LVLAPTAPTGTGNPKADISQPGPVVPESGPRRSSRVPAARGAQRTNPVSGTRRGVNQRWFYEPREKSTLALVLGPVSSTGGNAEAPGSSSDAESAVFPEASQANVGVDGQGGLVPIWRGTGVVTSRTRSSVYPSSFPWDNGRQVHCYFALPRRRASDASIHGFPGNAGFFPSL
jgi:hypothetical protein